MSTMSSRLVREWTKCSPSTDSRPAATQAKNAERKSFQAMTPMRKIVREPMIATEKRQPKESSAPKKIGRASCREGVESAAGESSTEHEERTDDEVRGQ